jgi:hypothetical protein
VCLGVFLPCAVLFFCGDGYFVDGILVTRNVPRICYILYVLCFLLASVYARMLYTVMLTCALVARVSVDYEHSIGLGLLYI